MNKIKRSLAFLLSIMLLAASVVAQRTDRGPANLHAGAVYVMLNQADNEIAAYARSPKGPLTFAGNFATGGSGDPGMPSNDPLGSQGALILSKNGQFLFAVNAGDDTISSMSVGKEALYPADLVNSHGNRPISLTQHDEYLYVLNAGGVPNISVFMIADDGSLTYIEGSTRGLIGGVGAAPAQIGIDPTGTLIAVTEKMGNRIDTYTVDKDGIPGDPIENPSIGNTPFGFAFNNAGFLLVSEAFGGMPGISAVSSYDANLAGILNVVSPSVSDMQTAACWLVVTNNGKLAFVSNSVSSTISSYDIDGKGNLQLSSMIAGDTGISSVPIDMALDRSSRYLYVIAAGANALITFEVRKGRLFYLDTEVGLPVGVQGVAAR